MIFWILSLQDDFVSKLKDHLLSRLHQYDYDGDECQFTVLEHNNLHFVDNLNTFTESKIFHVNHTSYDVHHQQGFMWPGSECTIMMLSREDGLNAHPFWYAQALRAFQIPIVHVVLNTRNHFQKIMEVLWVCWLCMELGYCWGFKEACLPKVRFVPDTDDHAFGFLDPSLVIHGCHLILAFSEGWTDTLLRYGESCVRKPGESDNWRMFYVNMYVNFLYFFYLVQHC